MASDFEEISDLLACPCEQHGRLRRVGADWVSECCSQVFRVIDGVLVLLRSS